MSMVIICEKPDVMRKVAMALGLNKKGEKEHYYTNQDESIYSTSVRGHFLTLLMPDEYKYGENTKEKDSWVIDTLPIVPEKFEKKVIEDSNAKSKLKTIISLCKKCDTIVNCGDADREGQIIVDEILEKYGFLNNNKKQIKRLWLPAQTEEDIRDGVANLLDNKAYTNLSKEGIAREYLDWLYGINITRLMTLKKGRLLNSGRLIIPIVKYIYDRDMAIKNFIPVPYFIVKSTKNGVNLITKEKWKTKEESIKQMEELNKIGKAVVKDIKEKEFKPQPKKLFSLNTLQQTLSKQGYKADRVLELAQSLYDKGLTTYPRTSSEYLKESEKDNCKKYINAHQNRAGKPLKFKDSKNIFDNSKVKAEKSEKNSESADTSHSAITPTFKISGIDSLSKDEKVVYEVICKRFYANFCEEETIIAKKEMIINVGDYEFKINGQAIKQEGYYFFEKESGDVMLPNLQIGNEFDVLFVNEEKKTTPPPKVSIIELFNWFLKPFKKVDLEKLTKETDEEEKENEVVDETVESDDEDYKLMLQGIQIGTEATRAETVKKCVNTGYITETVKKKSITYNITDIGIDFIETLDMLNINLYTEKTIEFSKLMKKVFDNDLALDEIVKLSKNELIEIIENAKKVEVTKMENKNEREVFGKLACMGDLPIYKIEYNKDGKKGVIYSSNNEEKPFRLYQETKLFGTPVKLTDSDVKKLLKGEQVLYKLKSNKTGKDYDALVSITGVIGKDEQYAGSPKFSLAFPSNK